MNAHSPIVAVSYDRGVQRFLSWDLAHLQTQIPQPTVPSGTQGGGSALALIPSPLPAAHGRC